MIRVEGYQNLYRDEKTGAIINHDKIGYDQYVNSVKKSDLQKKELKELRKDIDEIKFMLKEIINGSK